MESPIYDLEISDIIFANDSKVYAQVVTGTETGLYHVYTDKYLFKISIGTKIAITRWASSNHFPNKLFYRKLDINSFPELEAFILSKFLLE